MIFIDTCVVIEYLKDHRFFSKYPMSDLFLNDIVIMEIYQGAKNKHDLNFIKKEMANFQILNINQEIISLSKHILERYNLSHNMKIMDSLIASTAMIYGLDLMTLNRKDFIYLQQLNLVDF